MMTFIIALITFFVSASLQCSQVQSVRLTPAGTSTTTNGPSQTTISGETVLHRASGDGDYAALQQLIAEMRQSNASPYVHDDKRRTPLHIAVKRGRKDCVKLLLENGFDVNAQDVDDNSPLHLAALHKQNSCADKLCTHGARIDIPNKKDQTPLDLAVFKGRSLIVKALLQVNLRSLSPFDLNEKLGGGNTLLHSAALHNHLATVKVLSKAGARCDVLNGDGVTPLQLAQSKGHKDVVSYLSRKAPEGRDVADLDDSVDSLHMAAQGNNFARIRALCEAGVSPDKQNEAGKTALHIAAYRGYEDIVRHLLSKGAGLICDKSGSLPHPDLKLNNRDACIKALCSSRSHLMDVHDREGNTYLHFVAEHGLGPELAKWLVKEKHIPVNKKNFYQKTPLHLAAGKAHLSMVQRLLRLGAHLEVCSSWGLTPLQQAILGVTRDNAASKDKSVSEYAGDVLSYRTQACYQQKKTKRARDVVLKLLKKGAALDGAGNTSLMYAVARNDPEMIKVLLSKSADPNVRAQCGMSAINLAIRLNNVQCIEQLLKGGADPFLIDNVGCPMWSVPTTDTLSAMLTCKPELLLQYDAYGYNAFHRFYKNAPFVEVILDHDASAIDSIFGPIQQWDGDAALKEFFGCRPTALHLAAFENDQSAINDLLHKGARQDLLTSDGKTPYDVAIERKHYESAALLMGAVANGGRLEDSDNTLLHKVGGIGDVAGVEHLLSQGSDVAAQNNDGDTPLHMAARGGHSACVIKMLAAGANISALNKSNETPLASAAAACHDECCRVLLFAEKTCTGNPVLHIAVQTLARCFPKYQNSLTAFLQSKINRDLLLRRYDNQGNTAMHLAITLGNIALVECLFSAFEEAEKYECLSSRTKQGDGCLHLAIKHRHGRLARFLAEQAALVCSNNRNPAAPLQLAVQQDGKDVLFATVHGQLGMLNMLLCNDTMQVVPQSGGSKMMLQTATAMPMVPISKQLSAGGVLVSLGDKDGNSPLHIAVQKGCEDIVIDLLRKGALVDAENKDRETPLFQAAKFGYAAIARQLLGAGALVDDIDIAGNTPLHCVIQEGHEDLVQLLLAHNAHLSYRNNEGYGPTDIAVRCGRQSLVDALLTAGASGDTVALDDFGNTPLHAAVEQGAEGIVDVLLKHNVFVDACNKKGHRPLEIAVRLGYRTLVDKLLEAGATDERGCTPLHRAVQQGNYDMVSALFLHDCAVNVANVLGQTPLHLAAYGGYTAIADKLLRKGAEINRRDNAENTPLHFAAEMGREDLVESFLKQGASIEACNVSGQRPVHLAAKRGAQSVVHTLLGAESTDERGNTPLHRAVVEDQEAVVAALLTHGVAMDAKNADNLTALHLAVRSGKTALVELLLTAGAMDNFGNTPLHRAVKAGQENVVRDLLAKEASVEAENDDAQQPLHLAMLHDRRTLARILLSSGAPTEILEKNGNRPLHWAAEKGYEDIVDLLISLNASLDSENENEQTPLHIAACKGYSSIVQKLLEAGASIDAIDAKEDTPLHLAAKAGHDSVITALLSNDASVEEENAEGQSALHIASYKGWPLIVASLLEADAVVNSRDEAENTPLHLAVQAGHESIVDALLRSGASVDAANASRKRPIHLAMAQNHQTLIYKLLAAGASDECGNTPLHRAARQGDDATLKVLLSKEAKVDAVNSKEETPLHVAVINGHLSIIHTLLQSGASIQSTDSDGETPLHLAVRHDFAGAVDVLLDNHADVAAKNMKEETPLHRAAYNGNVSVAEKLLSAGDDIFVDSKDEYGDTALFAAVRREHEPVVEILINHGASVNVENSEDDTPLKVAMRGNQEAIAYQLLKKGASVSTIGENGDMPLHWAIRRGYEDVVDTLLSKKVSVDVANTRGRTPLYLAMKYECSESIVRKVLIAGASGDVIGAQGNSLLHWAAKRGFDEVVDILLRETVSIDARNDDQSTPLHLAAEGGKVSTLGKLLLAGESVNAVDKDGNTPLHLAVQVQQLAVVEKLLVHDITLLETKSASGQTALHLAAARGSNVIVSALLAAGASIDAVDEKGNTSLHKAAAKGHESIVRILMCNNANVNAENIDAVDEKGNTSLHKAAAKGHESIVRILMCNNANVNAENIDKQTPLYLAVQQGHVATVRMLLSNGADPNIVPKDEDPMLVVAIRNGFGAIATMLIEAGAALNVRDMNQRTPMHAAIDEQDNDIVSKLLDANVDIHAPDENGNSYLHLAAKKGLSEIVATLISKNASVSAENIELETPLHCAAKTSSLETVKQLLEAGADMFARTQQGNACLRMLSRARHLENLYSWSAEKLCKEFMRHAIAQRRMRETAKKLSTEERISGEFALGACQKYGHYGLPKDAFVTILSKNDQHILGALYLMWYLHKHGLHGARGRFSVLVHYIHWGDLIEEACKRLKNFVSSSELIEGDYAKRLDSQLASVDGQSVSRQKMVLFPELYPDTDDNPAIADDSDMSSGSDSGSSYYSTSAESD